MNPIVTLAALSLKTHSHGDGFEAATASVAAPIGASHLGARLVVVPPGKKAWPYHCHHNNDEMFVILDGAGTLRFGGRTSSFKAGDVVVCPAGGHETAHQLINSGTEPLRYLAISSMRDPDVFEYPDSGKFGVAAGRTPGTSVESARFHHFGRPTNAVDYWDGEV